MPQYELNLRDYLRIFRKRKIVIGATFIAAIIAGIVYVSMQPQVYKTSATVKIQERKTVAGLFTEWFLYDPGDIMASQAKIIKGFPIMKKVALSLGLIKNDFPISEIHKVVSGLQGMIVTERIERTNIIRITASASDAKQAMDLANMVVQIYIEENLLEKKKQASAARQFIEEQLTQLQTRMEAGEESLRKFSSEVRNVRLAEPLQEKMVDLEFELAAFLQKYTDKHPRVIQLREQIENLEEQLKDFSGEELEYARLVREVEVNRKLYAMLKEKLEEARITEAQKVGDVSVVDPAVMPYSSMRPQKSMGVFIGGIMGLILGIGLAFMLETLDTSIGTIEDVENLVKLPVIGIIPSVSSGIIEEETVFERLKRKILPAKKGRNDEAYMHLIGHHKPKSPVAEAYRNLRTNLKFSSSRKTFLITSAGPREGKTTILSNLGLSIAQKGVKVALVSSDLRRPTLGKAFGIRREPGLNEVIAGTLSLDSALKNISDIMLGSMELDEIMKTPGMENMWILTSGQLPFNPAEVLESRKLTKVIEELRHRFDVVLFDSPPVLPVTDPSLLASKVDSVVICYEIGKTARAALLRTKVQLESTGAEISGVVLNHISPQTETAAAYPYYYHYKYGYYGEGESGKKGKKPKKGEQRKEPPAENEA